MVGTGLRGGILDSASGWSACLMAGMQQVMLLRPSYDARNPAGTYARHAGYDG